MDDTPEPPEGDPPKAGPLLLAAATALVLLNMWLGFAREMRVSGEASAAIGGAVFQLILPVLVALLFSIGRRFRNERSRTKAVLWSSVVLLLAALVPSGAGSDRMLAAEVRRLNSGPRMVDNVTRFDRATQGPGLTLTIDETLVTLRAADVSRQAWQNAVPRLRQQMALGAPGALSRKGITVIYRYFGKDGVLIGSVTLNP
jgi:hypothetical protein